MKILALIATILPFAVPCQGETDRRTMLIVASEPGEARYETEFRRQAEAWKELAARGNFEIRLIGTEAAVNGGDRPGVEKALAEIPRQGGDFWIVWLGHGSFDGRTANFNLRGPDLSSTELRDLLKPFQRRLVILNLFSASAPFGTALAGQNRVIIGSTRSDGERNYSRFGEMMAGALTSPDADLDRDGALSLLEATLFASSKVKAFYEDAQRVLQEHAVIDDNGDGVATQVDTFKGLRAEPTTAGQAPDGSAARDLYFLTATVDPLSPEARAQRAEIEAAIDVLRQRKAEMPEGDYYRELEILMRRMAGVYGKGG